MGFELKILGSGSALPAYGRHHASQFLMANSTHFLIDCGEGTQMQFGKYQIKSGKLEHILISHLHGDHYLGLVGLLSSLHLQGRTKSLNLYGPPGLSEIILANLKYSQTVLNFTVHFHETNDLGLNLLFENEELMVHSFPLNHRIQTTGFKFTEKQKPRLIIKGSLPYGISHIDIQTLKSGNNVLNEKGEIKFDFEAFTTVNTESVSYAYCSDTLYDERICNYVSGATLLFHEATFTQELIERARITFHTTAQQAGILAKKANVKSLLLGHFSSRYSDLAPFLKEAQFEFPETKLAYEGLQVDIQ